MPTINVGRVRPLWKGAYDYQTAYAFFDWVSYNGSSYIVIASSGSAAGILPTNTTYWACIAEQGEIGPIGPKGEDGDKGAYIGQLVMSLVPISDSGVHILDGSILTVGGIYDAFITKIAALLSTNPGLFCTQTEFDESVSAYGSCGKFVYTAGVSLRLPKISDIVQCTTDVSQCGALIEAGLPGASGIFTTTTNTVASEASGIVSVVESESNGGASNMASGTMQKVTVDLSDASGIYGNSTTVQPQVIKALVYMVVSSSVKTEVEVDIDNITTDLNAISGSVATNTQDISALQTSVATNTQDISALQTSVATKIGVPVGTIEYFAMPVPPAGYLKCDGAAVGRETYPELYAAIGTTFGAGDGSTTFNLPDLIGRFAEGSVTPGQYIEAGSPNIKGRLGHLYRDYGLTDGGGQSDTDSALYWENTKSAVTGIGTNTAYGYNPIFDASRSNPIYGNSDTVQPPALTLLPCIKAFDAAVDSGLINITELANEVAGKADKTQVANLAMPSNFAVELTIGESGQNYTMPADGFLELVAIASGTGHTNFIPQNNGPGAMLFFASSDVAQKMVIPVRKGEIVKLNYESLNKSAQDTGLYFWYSNGSKP